MHPAIAVMAAIIVALMGFAAVLLAGVRLVKRLALPQDPPEDILFCPPPPPVLTTAAAETAVAAAAAQAERAAPFSRAQALHRQAAAIHEAAQAWAAGNGDEATARQATCAAAIERIEAPIERLHQALLTRDGATIETACNAEAATIEAAHASCQAAIDDKPPADHRRLWLMLALLAVAIAFQVMVMMIARGDGAP